MLLFTRLGRMSLLQHPIDTTALQVYVHKDVDVERLVALFNEIGREDHAIERIFEGDYRSIIVANKTTVAEAVARLIAQIDYLEFMRTVRFDFGRSPTVCCSSPPTGWKWHG